MIDTDGVPTIFALERKCLTLETDASITSLLARRALACTCLYQRDRNLSKWILSSCQSPCLVGAEMK